ncbi:hypothetical protein AX14_004902 [Amanita brunnescens Koide BX004]|nr:hypothetical protein AX14_004902 [Amanita brunnescens Koide BX004]
MPATAHTLQPLVQPVASRLPAALVAASVSHLVPHLCHPRPHGSAAPARLRLLFFSAMSNTLHPARFRIPFSVPMSAMVLLPLRVIHVTMNTTMMHTVKPSLKRTHVTTHLVPAVQMPPPVILSRWKPSTTALRNSTTEIIARALPATGRAKDRFSVAGSSPATSIIQSETELW